MLKHAMEQAPVVATSSGGKGKPPACSKGKCKGSSKGKGNKGLHSSESNEIDLDELDPAKRAGARRANAPIFGGQTQLPTSAMLTKVERPFPTFLNALHEHNEDVASIDRAFGCRGRLLIHACVAGFSDPVKKQAEETSKQPEVKTKTRFTQVIKGDIGPLGDKRRVSLELRFKRVDEQVSRELAKILDSLDFDAFTQVAADGHLDAQAFFPQLNITLDDQLDALETQKVEDSFLMPDERHRLLAIEQAGQVDDLHSIERRILPLAHVRAFEQKIKLFHIHLAYSRLEGEVVAHIRRVQHACKAVCSSARLLDLLNVTLQVATYVARFGTISVDEEGFSLLRLKSYETFKIGKSHSLLSVLCAFLANLRPRPPMEHTARSPHVGLSFAESLDKELEEVRSLVEGVKPSDMQLELKQLEDIAAFVERQLSDEIRLFAPTSNEVGAKIDIEVGTTRFETLQHWAQGRSRLKELHEAIRLSLEGLRGCLASMAADERRLKEFAALREPEMEKVSSFEVLGAVLQFVDHLKRTCRELKANPSEHLKFRRALLAATPVQIIFSVNCLAAAFDLWMRKAASAAPSSSSKGRTRTRTTSNVNRPKRWSKEEKRAAIFNIFRLFDTDADGAIDAEELRVTVQAFGIQLPGKDDELHYDVVRLFDANRSGKLEFDEFEHFVDARIKMVFDRFLQSKPADSITAKDLEVVASELERDDATLSLQQQMLSMLDNASNGNVNASDFEQLILMPPEAGAKEKEIEAYLNRPLLIGVPKPKTPRAWLLKGEPGDGGSDPEEHEREEVQHVPSAQDAKESDQAGGSDGL
eukprot:TRINITY_DN17194_c0_g1_i1.p1 TRINITY_DN17194_c0_g1~~TRINITY_DN17194_c0_g1_i1.p1  ORF type:complete len:881 (+),score=136.88 TRINITY_DN17194_c0_g1_i1:204-2645(+)